MEKTLLHQWNISPSLIVPMKKAWFNEGSFYEVIMVMLKDKKMYYKRYNVNENYFYAPHEVDKSN